MSITAGNPKCFELSKALYSESASVVVTSGDSTKNNLIDFNKLTRWQSVGSNDSTTETITITFQEISDISRLLILGHNWDTYTIAPVTTGYIQDHTAAAILDHNDAQIEDDGDPLSFANVISPYSSTPQTGISESGYSQSNSYYEFDVINCTGIKISITKAQPLYDVPNQEKFAFRVIPTIELDNNNGTFQSYPDVQRPTDYFAVRSRMIGGKHRVQKLNSSFSCGVFLRNNPLQSDVTLIQFLRNYPLDFLFYPSGGDIVANGKYRFESLPFNIDDIYQMQVSQFSMGRYVRNITSNPIDMSIGLLETI
jgi:hypothetical protein